MLIKECKNELIEHIIPFWNSLEDKERCGFFGLMDYNLVLHKDADKGVILNSRILWFYSTAYLVVGGDKNLRLATHAYEFLKNFCLDKEFGGVYWMMDCDGKPSDTMKHTYNQAFAIYALSMYYEASKNTEALDIAFELFNTIETKTLDEFGYMEAFSREWSIIDNDALSENGLIAHKTMNTVLHLIEAYTQLYRVKKDEKVAERLKVLLSYMKDKVFDENRNALRVFFDKEFNEIGDIHSYGHDIEATWLTDLACELLGDKNLIEEFKDINLKISGNIQRIAMDNGALNNESENGEVDKKRVWWVQAEGIVGFINAYQKSMDTQFLDTAVQLWEYTKASMVDNRKGGEWYSEVEYDGTPKQSFPIVGPWKCPYHNGRMCLEIISRGVDR